MTVAHEYLEQIKILFEEKRDAAYAEQSKAYLLHQFPFIGLRAAERRNIIKGLFTGQPLPDMESVETLAKELWALPERDYHHAAIHTIAFHKKLWQPETIQLLEYGITHNSWWDTVDTIVADCASHLLLKFPINTPTTTAWNQSNNLWLQRSSIIYQKGYRHKTNEHLLTKHILTHIESKEFFLQKAIGWALRSYAETNPQWVLEFVNRYPLAALSKREAVRKIK